MEILKVQTLFDTIMQIEADKQEVCYNNYRQGTMLSEQASP
jgi:hypothetical protein